MHRRSVLLHSAFLPGKPVAMSAGDPEHRSLVPAAGRAGPRSARPAVERMAMTAAAGGDKRPESRYPVAPEHRPARRMQDWNGFSHRSCRGGAWISWRRAASPWRRTVAQ